MENYFSQLNSINVNEHTEKKNNLTYLAWAYAWGELKKAFPDSTYKIYENENGWFYHTDGKTCWVKTGVTVNGIENIEYLPVMDYRNKSISSDSVTSFDVNKAIQRSLTKAVARHGLGLYIYAGEDLPNDDQSDDKKKINKANQDALIALMSKAFGSSEEAGKNFKSFTGFDKSSDVTNREYDFIMERLEEKIKHGNK